MNKVAFWLLWCFIFVLPWDVLTYLPVLGSIPRLVGLAASAVGILHILARGRIRPLSWFHVFATLFVLWAGVTSFWSNDPETTRTRFLTYFQLLVLVWLIWEIAWSPERQRALLQAYVLGACVSAIATVHNYLSGVAYTPPSGATARFVALNQDPNYLGVTLVLALPMAWYLSLSRPHERLAWTWQLYVPLAVAATLLTASRGSFLAALVALVIIPWARGHLRLRTKIALYAFVVGSLVLASNFVPETSLERILSTRADMEAGYFGGRASIWRAGLEVAREHLLVGVGAGAFEASVAPPLSPHQTFLAILVEQGIVGLSLLLAMMAASTLPLRHLPSLQRRFWIVLLGVLGVACMSIDWDHRKQFWLVLGLLAAQVAEPTLNSLSSRRRLRSDPRWRGTPGAHLPDAAGRWEESARGG